MNISPKQKLYSDFNGNIVEVVKVLPKDIMRPQEVKAKCLYSEITEDIGETFEYSMEYLNFFKETSEKVKSKDAGQKRELELKNLADKMDVNLLVGVEKEDKEMILTTFVYSKDLNKINDFLKKV